VDAVSDPGNLGTMLRSAHAAGAGAVYLLPGCADPYGPKALRAAMGSAFALNLFELEHLEPALGQWRREGRRLVLADAGSGLAPYEVNLTRPVILALGGEARGPSAGLRAAAEVSVRIPMPGGAESLNVAMAASILLYETVRQRACLPPGPCDIIGPRGSPTLGGAG
jgi:TrmH family RNA methyltransferase